MTKFCFVSPNSFLTLPPVKQLYNYFKLKSEIFIVQSQVLTYEDFFKDELNYLKVNIYQTYDDYHRQSKQSKIKKIVKLLFFYIRRNSFFKRSSDKRIIYTHELFPLFIAIFFKSENEFVVYHQFEVLNSKLNIIDKISLWYIKRNFDKVKLAIFPEKNRGNLFLNNIRRFNKNQVLIIPNTNNNKKQTPLSLNKGKVIVTHIGGLSLNYHLNEYLQAILSLDADRYEFRFIGRISDEALKVIDRYKKTNIKVIGQVRHNELEKYYRETDIGVILYKDLNLNYRYCAPNKLYEYWSYGIPVIGDQLPGLTSVFTHQCLGQLVNMQSSQNIVNAIKRTSLSLESRLKVQEYFIKHFKLSNYLDELSKKLEI